ncbi:hypothetical protein ABQD97_19895 [Enterococcus avium]|uniref:Fimbrial assembly protein n=1 Tax=Enterococcus avium TaxID=33945 RepID=A0ABD5FED3_ENTAV|nr:hypothetical protein [Enterococcus avium]MDT2397135.1 hypothetical protein [Enterococcus avium]MDT2435023.1 hypothetical protein [Enterococcus avium]MDT2449238.1 hypothetical protein [Enterococcus avium]MDT2465280.1 hypothetical protein [Enterococcus avium]MDT2469588.1 hypothetical protein [Enterococcus avium]
MKVFIGCCLAVMGVIFLCLSYRLMVHYQLNRINAKQTSLLFQTKLYHFKQKERQKSFMYLFAGIMGLITILSFAILQLFQMDTQIQGLRTSNRSLKSEVKSIRTKRSTKDLLKEYPSSGLGFKHVLAEKNQLVEKKNEAEQELSVRLSPYFQEANLIVSSNSDSDLVNFLLTGSIENNYANLIALGQNITEFMKELESIEKIGEVHITIVDREGKDLYKGVYVRNKKGQFTFQSKMREGKG